MLLSGSNCKSIPVGFGVLALARGGRASHFLVKTPAKKGGNDLEDRNLLGGESEAEDRRTQIGSY
jgi:hypothetical protein